MVTADLARYKPLFLQTAWEYVRQLEHSIDILNTDATNKEAIASVHLCAHSLKSQCAVMEYPELSGVCKIIEEQFRALKDDGVNLTPAEIQTLTTIVNRIKESLATISTNDTEHDMAEERTLLSHKKGDHQ